MMHPTDDVLNDYVDEGLGAAARARVDQHLRECARCRQAVEGIREIGRIAGALDRVDPPARVWTRIRQTAFDAGLMVDRPGTGDRRWWTALSGRWGVTALATAAALVVAAIALRVSLTHAPETRGPAASSGATSAPAVAAELQQAEEHYRKAIEGLERSAASGEGTLDPDTAQTLKKNLAVVDQAISESRAALRSDPGSEPAEASLLDGFRAKVALLEDTIALINEMRKGHDAAAARIVSSLERGT